MHDEALTNVKAPPPTEYDVAQFKDDDLSDCIARPERSVVSCPSVFRTPFKTP
jgi:hypothetical protein